MTKHTFTLEIEADNVTSVVVSRSAAVGDTAPGYNLPIATPAPVPTIPAPPIEGTPIPPAPNPDYISLADNRGVAQWSFLDSLRAVTIHPVPVPTGIIAKFAPPAAGDVAGDRAWQMNRGNAGFKLNEAYEIVETPAWNVYRRNILKVLWDTGDKIPGVVAFTDNIGSTSNPIPVTAEVAKAMLLGRAKRMQMSQKLQNWRNLDMTDYRSGLTP